MIISIKKLSVCDYTFILYFTYSIWVTVFKHFLPDNLAYVFTVTIMICYFSISLLATYQVRQINDVIILYLVVVVLFALTYLLNSNVRYCYWDEYWGISRIVKFSSGGIWTYLAVRLVSDPEKLFSNLKICAYIIFAYSLYTLFRMLPVGMWYLSNNQGVYQYTDYNLGFGYNMIFVSIVFLCSWFKKKKPLDLIIMIVAAYCAIIWGSRGSILCIAMAVLLFMVSYLRREKSKRRVIVFSVVIFIILLLIIFYEAIINLLISLLYNVGISSRTLERLLSGTFTDDTARANIWSMVLDRIKTVFPFGLGAYGDREVVMSSYAWGYSHNIFLEMTISFGVAGIAFLVWLLYKSVRIFWRNDRFYYLMIIFISMFMKLFVSDSFWFYWAFWGLLAICISNRPKLIKVTIGVEANNGLRGSESFSKPSS